MRPVAERHMAFNGLLFDPSLFGRCIWDCLNKLYFILTADMS